MVGLLKLSLEMSPRTILDLELECYVSRTLSQDDELFKLMIEKMGRIKSCILSFGTVLIVVWNWMCCGIFVLNA